MSSDRDVTRIVRSWLEEGATQFPDRLLDSVLDQLPSTPQRRATWPAWRFVHMSNAVRVGMALVGVAVVAVLAVIIGSRFFGTSNVGGPGPAATPSPTPQALTELDAPLEAGTYVTDPFDGDAPRITFTVPDGWYAHWSAAFSQADEPRSGPPGGMGLAFNQPTGLYSDPCNSSGPDAPPDVPIGDSMEELAAALTEQTAYEVTTPTEVTFDGYPALRLDIQLPDNLTECAYEEFWVWDGPGAVYAQGPGNRWHVWIVDGFPEGDVVVVYSLDYPETSAEDQAELQAIVDSITFGP